MAVLLDLSDELVILIASNITKPSHVLQFALASRKVHGIAIQHLYNNVTFDRDDYPFVIPVARYDPDSLPHGRPMNDLRAPHSNALCLSNMVQSNTVPAGQIITGLTISVNINNDGNQFQTMLSLLLPQLSSLKHLTLKSVSEDRLAWQREPFSIAALAVALQPASQTLQSLSMHFWLDPDSEDGWTIGSLRHFSKLDYLSIQDKVLLGEHAGSVSRDLTLDTVLPPGLKKLRLHWCLDGGTRKLSLLLLQFVDESLEESRKTELVVELSAKAMYRGYWSDVEEIKTHLREINEQEGLDLKIALEWRKDPHCLDGSRVPLGI